MRIAVVLLAVFATAVLATAAPAAATTRYFETPSRNIVCGYFVAPGTPATLECGVASGLNPPAPKPSPACRGADPASDRIRLGATGKPYGFCSGDVGVLAEAGMASVLQYGLSLTTGPFRCSSATAGLTCKNHQGHGFFLSRQSWRSF